MKRFWIPFGLAFTACLICYALGNWNGRTNMHAAVDKWYAEHWPPPFIVSPTSADAPIWSSTPPRFVRAKEWDSEETYTFIPIPCVPPLTEKELESGLYCVKPDTHKVNHLGCEDKSRILLQSQDGKWWCEKVEQ